MKIDFNRAMTDLHGQPVMKEIPTPEGSRQEVMLLKDVCLNCLLNLDDKDTPEEKVRKFKLAMDIHNKGEFDIQPEDVVLIKSLVGKLYSPLAVGRAYEMLDN